MAALVAPPQIVTARAQDTTTPADRTALSLTVYQGFGMVSDTRRVEGGAQEIVWSGVARTLDPGTAILLSGDDPVPTASMVFEPDPGPFGLLQEGDPVFLVSPTGDRMEATVVSPGALIFRAGDRLILEWKGHIEVPDPGRVRDPSPVIRWELAEPARTPLTAAYMAGGLSWAADYTAILEGEERLSLEGHATVENHTGMAWPAARLQLVAGVVRREAGLDPRAARRVTLGAENFDARMEAAGVAREALGEYHLYTVDEPVTLRHESVTRIGLLSAPRVPVERRLVLEGGGWWYQGQHEELPPQHPQIRLRFDNEEGAGLGEPLPAGTIHVYGRDARGGLQFLGDGAVPHTPAGEDVRLTIGESFDVTARRIQTDWRRIDDRTEESAWRVELANAGDAARTVQVVESFPGDWTVLEESRPHEQVDARTARWEVPVPARGSATLTYRVRVSY